MSEDPARSEIWALPGGEQEQRPAEPMTAIPMAWPVPPRLPWRPDSAPRPPWLRVLAFVAAVLVVVAGVVAVAKSSGASSYSYAVRIGPAGVPADPILPDPIGPFRYLLADTSPPWTLTANLLPTSPAATFAAMGGTYIESDNGASIDVDLDVVYAIGDAGHHGVFSLGPAALVDQVMQNMQVTDAKKYAGSTSGNVLECTGTGPQALCVWADQSTLGVVTYSEMPGSVAQLAAISLTFRSAVEQEY